MLRDVSGSMQGDPPKVAWQELLTKHIEQAYANRRFRLLSYLHLTRGKPRFFFGPDSSGRMSGTDMEAALKACMESLRANPVKDDLILIITGGEES
jgi:uncharacterized protein with von Willebrand factor type A (vWA) domain